MDGWTEEGGAHMCFKCCRWCTLPSIACCQPKQQPIFSAISEIWTSFFIGGLWELFINCSPKWEVAENFFVKTGHNQTDPVEKPQSWNEFLYISSGVNIPGWPGQGKCMRNTEMPNKVVSSTEGKKKERKNRSNQLKRCYFLSLFHITSLWTWQLALNDFITVCSPDLCRSCGICMWNSICHFISIYWG